MAALPRIDSGESVQQPNPFEAMLHHLRGPQYASPARFALRGRAALQLEQAESPQSPKELTPLHLISVTEGSTSPAAREHQGWLGLWATAAPPAVCCTWVVLCCACVGHALPLPSA